MRDKRAGSLVLIHKPLYCLALIFEEMANLKRTSFEPEPTQVVIHRECVARRPLGATAWSTVEGREYDEVENDDLEKDDSDKNVKKEMSKEAQEFMADLQHLTDGLALDPKFLDRRPGTAKALDKE